MPAYSHTRSSAGIVGVAGCCQYSRVPACERQRQCGLEIFEKTASSSTPHVAPKATAKRGNGRPAASAAISRATSSAPRGRSTSVNPPPPATGMDGGGGLGSARITAAASKKQKGPPKTKKK
ncbi:hypothetical protein BDV93DRAFT_567044 [Ceratobasidium sp. AG-I]|nr:hypothetical protein BDV93DRAFT_567044 [Ceratobasidium sp. AG-I]